MQFIPAFFNIHQDAVAEVIGVETEPAAGIDDPCVQARKFYHLRGRDTVEVEELRMPIACPALIDDLGLELGIEVVRLLTDDTKHVALPVLQRSVCDQEPQEIVFRMRRDPIADHLVGNAGGGGGQKIIVRLGFAFFFHNLPLGIRRPRDPKMRINVPIQRKPDIH